MDPDMQLAHAFESIQQAFQAKARPLEQEIARFDRVVQERNQRISSLESDNTQLKIAFEESQQRISNLQADYNRMRAEKEALAADLAQVRRDLEKARAFKTSIMESVKADDSGLLSHPVAHTHIHNHSTASSPVRSGSPPRRTYTNESSSNAEHLLNEINANLSRATPSRSYGAGGTSFASPAPSSIRKSMSPQRRFPTGSPSSAEGIHTDGKEFFRFARSRLNYDQFSSFLGHIKELNSGSQTRQETLDHVRDLFGTENHDLYIQFQKLISRHRGT